MKLYFRYYSQLHFLETRFKIDDKSEDGPFAFPWIEVYSGVMFTYCSLHYEMASVLYNIGALHTFLGMISHKMSLITIFGHKHLGKNFIKNFIFFMKKFQ